MDLIDATRLLSLSRRVTSCNSPVPPARGWEFQPEALKAVPRRHFIAPKSLNVTIGFDRD
jgi:hypothetical protein